MSACPFTVSELPSEKLHWDKMGQEVFYSLTVTQENHTGKQNFTILLIRSGVGPEVIGDFGELFGMTACVFLTVTGPLSPSDSRLTAREGPLQRKLISPLPEKERAH